MPTPPYLTALQCLRCGRTYLPGEIEYVCACRPNLESDLGTLDAQWDYDAIRPMAEAIVQSTDSSIARFAPLLPVANAASLPPLRVGNTPFGRAGRLGAALGLANLFLKDDGRNPSASLKDRASAIAVARARELGYPMVATASTGNAAAALASQAASAGMPTTIFVPQTAPPAKIAQLLIYGARVLALEGSYDQAFDLCIDACKEFGWYNRNTGYNPYMSEGKKTVAYEIALNLAADEEASSPFLAPDAVFVSVGDGCIIGGVWKGFHDLLQLGWIDRMPRIFGVQSTRSDAIARAWQDGEEVPETIHATTRADSISVDAPRDAIKALRAVRASGGAFITVEDEAILAAMLPFARLGGIFAEPAGSAALAGLTQAVASDIVGLDERIVVLNTGNGLKDVAAAMQVTGGVPSIPATLDAVRALIQ